MTAVNCFDAQRLKDYLLGKLSDEESDVIAAHLEACLTCEATMSQIDRASDTLTDGLRLPVPPGSSEVSANESLRRALDNAQALIQASERDLSSAASDGSILRDYRLLESLGSGGMGTVFKAVHSRLDRLVAVKLLPARRLCDQQAVARFQREMRVIGQLSHPAIVQATDAGEVDGTHFLVMEFVEGYDLNHIARAVGTLSIPDACEIARQAALGLEYAHQQGIVHRDIKPSNLMLAFSLTPSSGPIRARSAAIKEEGEMGRRGDGVTAAVSPPLPLSPSPTLKILDLGLALLSGEQAPVDELTTVGQLMGTLDYMAPEQLEDSHLVGPRADIYALAATLFRLLTGAAPFAHEKRKTPLQKLRALATQTAPPILDRRADIPAELAAIIDRALSREPNDRLATMNEFAAALAPFCPGHDLATLARAASQSESNPKRERGRALPSAIDAAEAFPSVARPESSKGVDDSHAQPNSHALRKASGRATQSKSSLSGASALAHASGYKRIVAAVLWIATLIGLAAVITIQTNKGQLVIETAHDGVELRIKKSGRTVDKLEVSKSGTSTKLSAGDYELEFVTPAEGLTLDKHEFTLKRGDVVVVKVTEVISAIAATSPLASKSRTDEAKSDAELSAGYVIESDADAAVRRKLANKINVEFVDLPLTDAAKQIAEMLGVEVTVNRDALNDEAIPLDVPVNIKVTGVTGESLLSKMLPPIYLGYEISDGALVITTETNCYERLTSRFYEVRDVLNRGMQPNRLIAAIQDDTSGPWQKIDEEGGTIEFLTDSLLIIRQTTKVHREITTFLTALRIQLRNQPEAPRTNDQPEKPVVSDVDSKPRTIRPEDLVDRNAKGMESFEAANPDWQAEKKIRERLMKKITVDFNETPLTEVVKILEQQAGIAMLLDVESLNDEAIPLESPVTRQLSDVSITTAMLVILRPLKLAWNVDAGQVVIATMTKSTEHLLTRMYPVGKLLPGVRLAVERLRNEETEAIQQQREQRGGGGFGGGGQGGGGFFDVPTTPWSRMRRQRQFGQGGGGFGGGGEPANTVKPTYTESQHFAELLGTLSGMTWESVDGEGGRCDLIRNVLSVRQTQRAHLLIESLLRNMESAFLKPITEPLEIRSFDYPLDVDEHIHKQLTKPLDADFVDVPLNEAVRELAKQLPISFLVDTEALNDEAIPLDSPVTLNLKNLPANVLWRRMLQPLKLEIQIEHGLLVITTATVAAERMVTSIYDIRDLVNRGVMPEQLIASLESGTSGPWQSSGGDAGEPFAFADTLLVVSQTPKVHDEVAKFLTSLRTQFRDQPEVPRVLNRTPKPPTTAATQKTKPNTGGTPAKPNTNQPRYDGKSFDEWLKLLSTERSPARLAEAMQALRLLANDDQLSTAVEQIFKLFRVVDPDAGGMVIGNLRMTLTGAVQNEVLLKLPAAVVANAAASELRNGNARSRKFLFQQVMTYGLSESPDHAPYRSANVVNAVSELTASHEPSTQRDAHYWLAQLARDKLAAPVAAGVIERLRAALKHNDSHIAMCGIHALWNSEPDTPLVVEALRRVLGKPPAQSLSWANGSPLRSHAIILAEQMGPRAAPAASAIAQLLLEEDEGLFGFGGGGLGGGSGGGFFSVSQPQFNPFTRNLVAVVVLARLGKLAAEATPILDKAIAAAKEHPVSLDHGKREVDDDAQERQRAFGAQDWDTVMLTWYDLLLALRQRIQGEEPNLKPFDRNANDAAAQLQQRLGIRRLIQTERGFLIQHRHHAEDTPEMKALNGQIKAIEKSLSPTDPASN